MNDSYNYIWFYVNNISGGTDVYYDKVTDIDKDVWKEEISNRIQSSKNKELIERYLHIGYSWTVRRSVGQPAIINLLYGFIAIAIAKFTNGLIYSSDNAWEYSCMPDSVDNFQKYYFKQASTKEFSNWIRDNMKTIKKQIYND